MNAAATMRYGLCSTAIGLVLSLMMAAPKPAAADPVRIRTSTSKELTRIVFEWPTAVGLDTEIADSRVRLRFDRPIDADLSKLAGLAPSVTKVSADADGRTLTLSTAAGLSVVGYPVDNTVVVDIVDADKAKTAHKPAAAPVLRVQSREHPGFSRLLFRWPAELGYRIQRQPGTISIVLDRPARFDLGRIAGGRLRHVSQLRAGETGEGTLTLAADDQALVRDFRNGAHVVVDVIQPGAIGRVAPVKNSTLTPMMPNPPAETPAETPADVRPADVSPAPTTDAHAAAEPAPSQPARLVWKQPTGAAAFRRGDALWLVLDDDVDAAAATLGQGGQGLIRTIDPLPHTGATVLRIVPADGVEARIDGSAEASSIEFGHQPPPPPSAAVTPRTDVAADGNARLFIPIAGAGTPLAIADPSVGDTIVVVPVRSARAGTPETLRYPQFHLLAAQQGIVIEARGAAVAVRPTPDGIEIGGVAGPILDGNTLLALPSAAAISARPSPLLDLDGWEETWAQNLPLRRRALERGVIEAPSAQRERARLDLARFLLANGFDAECLGILARTAADRPAIEDDAKFRAMRGAARLLIGRSAEAMQDFAHPAVVLHPEAALWRAAIATQGGRKPGDSGTLANWNTQIERYPSALAVPLGLLAAEAALAGGHTVVAAAILDRLAGKPLSADDRAWFAYLDGRGKAARGDRTGALAAWDTAINGRARRARAAAELARTDLLLSDGATPLADAIAALERIGMIWRGDHIELAVLRRLGQAYAQAKDYAAALRTLHRAAIGFANLPDTADAGVEARRLFERLLAGDLAGDVGPLTAVALYREFKELVPEGDARAAITANLVKALVGLDLLDQAAVLLDEQLATLPPGPQRAATGAELARIRLTDGRPEAALAALAASKAEGVAADLDRRRRHTEAEALSALGSNEAALKRLEEDRSAEAEQVRARVFRAREDWTSTTTARNHLVAQPKPGDSNQMTDSEARSILDVAVAAALAGDGERLAELRAAYGSAMARTTVAGEFRLIAGETKAATADPTSVAAAVEDALAFRKRLTAAGGGKPAAAASTR